jgi:small subunit ribosomal protein S16
MVRIRLARAGTKKAPFYRIVVADQRAARGGRFLEAIGTFDPRHGDGIVTIKTDRLAHWQGLGAQVTDTVESVLKKQAKAAAAAAAAV